MESVILCYDTNRCHLTSENNPMHCNGVFFYIILRYCYIILYYVLLFAVIILVVSMLLLIICFDFQLIATVSLLYCLFLAYLVARGIGSLLIYDCLLVCWV